MSEEDRKDFGAQFAGDNNVMRKMSEEEKLVFSLKVKEGLSKRKASLGEDEYQKLCQKAGDLLQAACREWRKTLTDEDKSEIAAKAVATRDSVPDYVKEQRRQTQSENTKRVWAEMTDEERSDLGKKISAAKKTKFTPEQDDYIKTHTIAECRAKFGLSAKPILKRRKELGINIYGKPRN